VKDDPATETTDPTPEEIAEMSELLGGKVQPIVVDEVEMEIYLRYVEKHGHLP